MPELNRRDFLKATSGTLAGAGFGIALSSKSALAETGTAQNLPDMLESPLSWLNEVYRNAAEKNVLAALNPKVFLGYFSVCADGQGFGYGCTYPSLDGHQLSHALLFLGEVEEVRANWDYVKRWQKPDGHLPIMIDGKGSGLYVHWAPGDPLRALGATTYAHNAFAIYTHTLDDGWLNANLESINLSASFLESLATPEGRVGGAGYYIEVPTRIEWDGVTQAYAVDAFLKTAALNTRMGKDQEAAHWAELAARIRANFRKEFWREDHCVEYIHPEHGPIDRHGLTDVDWAALATGLLPEEAANSLWLRVKDEPKFRYGGMPTGISTAPETYEDWEFIPAEQFPNNDRRHDLAAMGRVWYLESWARAQRGDVAGLMDSLKAVADAGAPNGYSWQERYFPSDQGLKPSGPMTYCEYPANLIRIVNQFLLGVEPGTDGTLRIAPAVPKDWWQEGWQVTTRIGAGTLTLKGESGVFSGVWQDKVQRRLLFIPPPGSVWKSGVFAGGVATEAGYRAAACPAPAGEPLGFKLEFS
jgi:hypothetical protein